MNAIMLIAHAGSKGRRVNLLCTARRLLRNGGFCLGEGGKRLHANGGRCEAEEAAAGTRNSTLQQHQSRDGLPPGREHRLPLEESRQAGRRGFEGGGSGGQGEGGSFWSLNARRTPLRIPNRSSMDAVSSLWVENVERRRS